MITLQDSVDSLHRIAVLEGKSTSTARLQVLADYCVQELERRGLAGAETEALVPGAGRDKRWDVAWQHGGRYRLGISLKSILRNLPGTVPNRLDDLMGETANVQLYSPEIVTGYVMVLDIAQDQRPDGASWQDTLARRLSSLSGRRPPAWATGMIEDHLLVTVDFRSAPLVVDVSQPEHRFFDTLAAQVRSRNPAATR